VLYNAGEQSFSPKQPVAESDAGPMVFFEADVNVAETDDTDFAIALHSG
jgi:hypothetical protein